MTPREPFTLGNVLRGRLAERILTVLLERGGYRVTRLGIEEVFDEIKYLDREQYLTLGLPEQLRTLPDLLVTDPAVRWAKLIEVKFRLSFSRNTADKLISTLTEQRRLWPESIAVINHWPSILGGSTFPPGFYSCSPSARNGASQRSSRHRHSH